ncbi:MAG: ABC transporter ATP-binding protein [Chitinophagaceae bacterium]
MDSENNIYDKLQETLQQDPKKGIVAMIGFLRSKPALRQLYMHAMVLSSNYNSTTSHDEQLTYIAQMQALVTTASESSQETSEELKKQAAIAKEKKKHFLEQGTPKKIVFDCNNINKTYAGNSFQLQEISLSLRLGEITGVVGENANGKTTLLKIISGEILHDSGDLDFYTGYEKKPHTNWQVIKSQMAYLPQELPRLYGTMIQNLRITASVNNITGRQNELEVDYIIQRLGLEEHQHKTWDKLSGGYKLRFSLARLLVRKPRLIVMDEPLASLDVYTTNIVLNDLRALANSISNPVSIIFSSQHIEEVETISDKILLLSKGRSVYYGPTENIGTLRTENTYEITTKLSREELEQQLARFSYNNLASTGLSYLITTDLSVTINNIMGYFSQNDIPIQSIRDISNSTRKYLLNNHESVKNEYSEQVG